MLFCATPAHNLTPPPLTYLSRYDAARDVVLVTGKLWPFIYEMKLEWPPLAAAGDAAAAAAA